MTKKNQLWQLADAIVARIGASTTPCVENAISRKCWIAFDKGGLSFRLAISTCPASKRITVCLTLDRGGDTRRLPHYETLLEATRDNLQALQAAVGDAGQFKAEADACIARRGNPKLRTMAEAA